MRLRALYLTMFAYNHYIRFIPSLDPSASKEISSSDIITITENNSLEQNTTLTFKMNFSNNQGRNLALYSDQSFKRTQTEQQWVFEVEEVVSFFWYSGSKSISYREGDSFTPELLKYWTLHIILPIFFTIEENCYFLHAGAVEVDAKPILFIAESFGGKSTMTDYFIGQGHPMISDDKVGIIEEEGKFLAIPSHPHHRPYRKMEDLGLYVSNMAKSPQPISAIYTLYRAAADAPISISELQGIEKFTSLRFSSILNLSFLKSKRFRDLGRLAKGVPVYKVMVPWDMERLEEVYAAITEHCRALE